MSDENVISIFNTVKPKEEPVVDEAGVGIIKDQIALNFAKQKKLKEERDKKNAMLTKSMNLQKKKK